MTLGPNSVRVAADNYGLVGGSSPALMMIGELFLLAGGGWQRLLNFTPISTSKLYIDRV